MNQALLIDIGSTNVKWAVTARDFTIIASNTIPFPKKNTTNNAFFEVDINKIYQVIQTIIDNNSEVKQLFISTQMHGYLLADSQYQPLTPYISWQDHRAKDTITPFSIDKTSGVAFKTNLPKASVMAMYHLYPNTMRQVKHFFTLGSYIGFKLTGQNATHITDAAATGYYAVIDDFVESMPFILPKAFHNVTSIGQYKHIEVFTAVGDQQASILGTNSDSSYVLNLGTAAQLCTINHEYIAGDFESRPFFNNQTLCTVTGLIGGKDIRQNTSGDLENQMIIQYQNSMMKLPKRDKVIVIGGVLSNHRQLVEKVLDKIGIPYSIDMESTALDGLNNIAKEVNKMEQNQTGIMISEIAFPNLPILLKKQGLDFTIIDFEHGGFDYKDIAVMIMNARLSNLSVYIRLADNRRKDIQKFLDMGADGLILPMTNSKDDILEVLKYAKYSPQGSRGISTMRAHSFYDPGNIIDYMKKENKRVKVFAQIETLKGVQNIDEILNLEQLEGIFVGPNDLSCDMDCLADNNSDKIHEVIINMSKICRDKNKKVGIITTNNNYLKTAKLNLYDYYSVGSELSLLKQSVLQTIKLVKE